MIRKNGPKNYLPPTFRELFTVLIKRDTDTFTTEKGCVPRLCQPHDPLNFLLCLPGLGPGGSGSFKPWQFENEKKKKRPGSIAL